MALTELRDRVRTYKEDEAPMETVPRTPVGVGREPSAPSTGGREVVRESAYGESPNLRDLGVRLPSRYDPADRPYLPSSSYGPHGHWQPPYPQYPQTHNAIAATMTVPHLTSITGYYAGGPNGESLEPVSFARFYEKYKRARLEFPNANFHLAFGFTGAARGRLEALAAALQYFSGHLYHLDDRIFFDML